MFADKLMKNNEFFFKEIRESTLKKNTYQISTTKVTNKLGAKRYSIFEFDSIIETAS